ncbi:sensor histidine kinase [Micromonospora sp. KC207]|nr:sensor histidine kinase [Micromonospora sp. KC207]
MVLSVPSLYQTGDGWRAPWIQAVVHAGLVLPLLWRRRCPVAAAATMLAAAWVSYGAQVWQWQIPIATLALLVVVYTFAVRGRRVAAVVMAGLVAVLFGTWAITRYPGEDGGWGTLGFLLMIAIAWVVGEFMRARREYFAEVERRATVAESERRALARAAVAEERNRIARELHDVLAHSVSVMVVNAEGAALIRRADPDAVDRTLKTISATGRAALGDLRRLVEVLHVDPSSRAPQPATADLRELVSRVSVGRPAIDLVVAGDTGGLPASAAVQAYRIVQEALTNVVKHAPVDAPAGVVVDFGCAGTNRVVRIEVTNGGGPVRLDAFPASGHGLTGMRERVAMFGGTLDAGPTGEGGYRVTATLRVSPT